MNKVVALEDIEDEYDERIRRNAEIKTQILRLLDETQNIVLSSGTFDAEGNPLVAKETTLERAAEAIKKAVPDIGDAQSKDIINELLNAGVYLRERV